MGRPHTTTDLIDRANEGAPVLRKHMERYHVASKTHAMLLFAAQLIEAMRDDLAERVKETQDG